VDIAGVDGHHILQAQAPVVERFDGAAEPQPSLLVALVLFDHLRQQVAGLFVLAGLGGGNPLAE
jgi:hypothetical protein